MTRALYAATITCLFYTVLANPPKGLPKDTSWAPITVWSKNNFKGQSYRELPKFNGVCSPIINTYDKKINPDGYGRGSFSVPQGLRCKLHRYVDCKQKSDPWHDQTDWIWAPGWTDWGNIFFTYMAYECRAALDATDVSPNQGGGVPLHDPVFHGTKDIPIVWDPNSDDVTRYPGRCHWVWDLFGATGVDFPGPCGGSTGAWPTTVQPTCFDPNGTPKCETCCGKRDISEDKVRIPQDGPVLVMVNSTAEWRYQDS